jgi:cephalosporin-C deacetylase-like acetyl esterase
VPRETYRWTSAALLALTLLAGCGDSSHKASLPKKLDPMAPYRYDPTKPIGLKTKRTERAGRIQVRDVSFNGPKGERVLAYLVIPPGRGKHPAVIYVHGAGGDRGELLGEGIYVAKRGAVALLLEMPHSQSRSIRLKPGVAGIKDQVNRDILGVLEVRRGVDLLRTLPFVDGNRLGYVGWSAGARIGAITAGVDHRISSFDLLAGGAAPVSAYAVLTQQNVRAEVVRELNKTDALFYVRRAAPSHLFFQDGRFDQVVPSQALRQLLHDASRPKEFRWYQTGHVPGPQAWKDSRDWLTSRLGLTRKA